MPPCGPKKGMLAYPISGQQTRVLAHFCKTLGWRVRRLIFIDGIAPTNPDEQFSMGSCVARSGQASVSYAEASKSSDPANPAQPLCSASNPAGGGDRRDAAAGGILAAPVGEMERQSGRIEHKGQADP